MLIACIIFNSLLNIHTLSFWKLCPCVLNDLVTPTFIRLQPCCLHQLVKSKSSKLLNYMLL